MSVQTIIAGSNDAVRDALSADLAWRGAGLDVVGAALIGAGDAAVPVIARAPMWEALNFPEGASLLLLAETPPSKAMRVVLARAAERRMKVLVRESGQLRALKLDDLLGPRRGALDWKAIANLIGGKRVLITGGGGSIGSELARRVASFNPQRLTLLDCSEFNLYRISHELPDARLAMADVRDAKALKRWMQQEQPHLVIHTAALKQVPLVEEFPGEGVLTNVVGLRIVAEAAQSVGADLVFLSTDKAVDPSGAMGASKRLGELYCQALDRRGGPRAISVRLGNVLGSTGSVAPLFERQLAAGGPLTVTSPEVTRYFLTIPQAANALLQAAAACRDGARARGAVLVVDMGEAVPIVDLAADVIRLAGLKPREDVEIKYVGMRLGEKLHEQLIASDEQRGVDPAPGVIAAASAPRGLAELNEVIDRLAMLAREGANGAVMAELFAALETPAAPAQHAARSNPAFAGSEAARERPKPTE